MNISARIRAIADFIESSERVADVGADHGYLELYLLAKHSDIFITAIENKKGPYSILENNLKGFKNIKLSLSDGLDKVDESTTTLVLAGMGGLNIKIILDKRLKELPNISKIIVDAHRDIDVVRKTLIGYGFKISKEVIVYEDKKFYVINEFIKSKNSYKYNEDELEFGYRIYKNKLWPEYRDYLIERNNKTIEKVKDNKTSQNIILKLKNINERLMNYGKE